jgi:cysteine desulfurase
MRAAGGSKGAAPSLCGAQQGIESMEQQRHVYMDHNATTPLHPEVRAAMTAAMDVFGNPSSLHDYGRDAKALVDDAREQVAALVGATPEEVVFVGSGSEANNTVLSALACAPAGCSCARKVCASVITTGIEHPCVLDTAKCLRERGVEVAFLGVDASGKVDMEQLAGLLKKGAGLVSIMTANNEIGTVQDIKTLARMAHDRGALFHTDAVQAVGKIPVDVAELGVDFLTFSAHKLYGPKGVGALYVKKDVPFCPLVRGGHQERGRRAGTENTIGIVGFGKAAEMRRTEMPDETPRLLELRAALRQGIENTIADVSFNGHPADCVPNTLNASFDGVEGETILLYLDFQGIAVSTGSACASGSLDPSHVLLATGLSPEQAHGSIRMSLGRENTMADVDHVLSVLPGVIERTRRMSTAYRRKVV